MCIHETKGRVGQKEKHSINEAQLKVSGLNETRFNCFLEHIIKSVSGQEHEVLKC